MKKWIVKRVAVTVLALIVILNLLDAKSKIGIPVDHAATLISSTSYWS